MPDLRSVVFRGAIAVRNLDASAADSVRRDRTDRIKNPQVIVRTKSRPADGACVNEQRPLPYGVAARGVGRCMVETGRLLFERRTHLPRGHVGMRVPFADGTIGRVYRETIVDHDHVAEACVLVVKFRLRLVHGEVLHALFRAESLLNTPLFVGFSGLVSKLWMAHDQNDVYRGFYEWDGAARAEQYARSLWRVLALVSESDSIAYVVVPGLTRDEALADPARLGAAPAWARPVHGIAR